VSRLKDLGRTYLAWGSIVQDAADERIDLTIGLSKQAKRNVESAEKNLQQTVREAFKWLICPSEVFDGGKPKLTWEAISVSSSAPNIMSEIESKLHQEEWLISEWSPIHLRNLLKKWYFKDGASDVSALKLWQDSCNYLYLPRLVNDLVLKQTIAAGIETEDFFGYASGKEDGRYLGFIFGKSSSVTLDESALLIDSEAALEYRAQLTPPSDPPIPEPGPENPDGPEAGGTGTNNGSEGKGGQSDGPSGSVKKQFYGTIDLDPLTAKMQFSEIINEVVEQFTTKTGVNLKISVEIEASSRAGFDESTQRAVKENCNVLRFGSYEFEDQ
jgi:hypothetical protein